MFKCRKGKKHQFQKIYDVSHAHYMYGKHGSGICVHRINPKKYIIFEGDESAYCDKCGNSYNRTEACILKDWIELNRKEE